MERKGKGARPDRDFWNTNKTYFATPESEGKSCGSQALPDIAMFQIDLYNLAPKCLYILDLKYKNSVMFSFGSWNPPFTIVICNFFEENSYTEFDDEMTRPSHISLE